MVEVGRKEESDTQDASTPHLGSCTRKQSKAQGAAGICGLASGSWLEGKHGPVNVEDHPSHSFLGAESGIWDQVIRTLLIVSAARSVDVMFTFGLVSVQA